MRIDTNDQVILKELYPIVEEKMKTRERQFKNNIGIFLNKNSSTIHDIAPYNQVYFNKTDEDKMFTALQLKYADVEKILKKTFFWKIKYNPQCAKDPATEVMFCALRYYLKEGNIKDAILTTVYICFSGKFYASLFYAFWRYPPIKQVMDYVVNNCLSEKFDLKKEGTVYKAIVKMSETYIEKYGDMLKENDITDEEWTKHIQQLRDREKSFFNNISNAYYTAYESGNYMNYEFQVEDETNFRLTESDATTAARVTQNTMNVLTSQSIDQEICNRCVAGKDVDSRELKSILESITSDKNNFYKLGKFINITICLFMEDPANKGKRIGGIEFVTYCLKPAPNTKNQYAIEKKQIIVDFLNQYSDRYRVRKKQDTKNNYVKALMSYLVMIICKVVNK